MTRVSKKINFVLTGLILIFGLPALALASVSISSLTVSNTAPSPGSVIGVTVVYCETANTTPFFLVALNPNSTTMQPCPAASQVLLVDGCTCCAGTSPVSSTRADSTDACGGNGWGGVPVPNSPPPCPYTQIFNVTIPLGTSPGPFNLIVAAGDYFVQCGGGIVSTRSTVLNIPLPPPGSTITKRAEGPTTAPGSLVLFSMDYTFVNTTGVTITDTVPSQTNFYAISPGGTQVGSNLTWILYNGVATSQKNGTVWFLAQVKPTTPDGTTITNTATLTAVGAPVTNSSASTTVTVPLLSLIKSQSASSLASGGIETYSLSWSANNQSLQLFDSYSNVPNGTTNGSIVGYDNTGYTYTNSGGIGGFTVRTDASGNNYIQGCAYSTCNSGVTNGNFPSLLRNGPTVGLCNNFTVVGDMQIPIGSDAGADSTMVIADNLAAPGVNDAYMVGISLDCGPGNFFIQKNQSPGSVSFPAIQCNAAIGTTITAGVWYTVKVFVTYSGSLNIRAKVWPRGTGEPAAWSINWTDPSPLPCVPINGGTYKIGWQADGTSSTDYFTNLKVFGPGPVVNPQISDLQPAGVSYLGSSSTTASGPPSLSWSFPGTFLVQSSPLSWWGTVACPGPISNQFTMNASGIPVTTSNTVNLTVTGCNPTPTPTPLPAGCKVLVYLNVGACDGTGGSTGSAVTNLIGVLANAGAQVTTIGVCANSYCPTADNWSSYNQVWDARFVGKAAICSGSPAKENDYFDTCWQNMATTYIQNGGNFYLQVENAGYPSRSFGNDVFLRSVGAATGGFTDCPLGATTNDYAALGVSIPSSLPGAASFFGFAVGGIPVAVSNGTNFVTYTGPWNNSGGTNRSIATGWTAAQMTLGAGAGNLFTCWDTTMWTGGYYSGGNKTITDTFFTNVYKWLGGTACGTSTPTPTNTPTNTPSPSPTNTPTLTPTFTPTPAITNTPTRTPTTPPTMTPTPGLHVWPNPFNPKFAVGGVLKAEFVPSGSTMNFYTVSGESVRSLSETNGIIRWDARNNSGAIVSTGTYYYVIQNGDSVVLTGKILVLID